MNTLEDLLTYSSIGDDGEHQSSKSRCQWDRCGSGTLSEISVISLLELGIPSLGVGMGMVWVWV